MHQKHRTLFSRRVRNRSRARTTLLGAVLVGVLALAACGGAVSSDGKTTADLALAPDFEVTLYQGEGKLGAQVLQLSDLRGKPLVLNFWAGLCPPCQAEMPDLQAFYEEFGDRVTLLGLDVGPFTGLGSNQNGRDLLKDLDITYPAGTTEYGDVVREYEVFGMPTTVFITEDGRIFSKWINLLNAEVLAEITEEMLAFSQARTANSGEAS